MEKDLAAVSQDAVGNSFLTAVAEIPGAVVLAVGPPSCMRCLYFSFYQQKAEEYLFLLPLKTEEFAAGLQVSLAEESIREIIREYSVRAVLVCTSCVDVLASTGYRAMGRRLEKETGVFIDILDRGPLSAGKITQKERFLEIRKKWLEKLPTAGTSGEEDL